MTAFANLTPRERWLILGALPLGLLLIGWIWVWQPLQREREALRARIADALTVQAVLDRYPAEATPLAARSVPEGPISARVTRSAQAAGIDLARLEPRGAALTALVDETPFDAVVDWIGQMERNEGLRLTRIEIDRRPTPGAVSARLDLEDAR